MLAPNPAAVLCVVVLAGCAGPAGPVDGPTPGVAVVGIESILTPSQDGIRDVDWARATPTDVLDALIAEAATGRHGVLMTRSNAPDDWFTDEQLAALHARADSSRAASHVIRSECSVIPFGRGSTEGVQARVMLYGHALGRYPPTLSSAQFPPPPLAAIDAMAR